jgi:hypothetical protein
MSLLDVGLSDDGHYLSLRDTIAHHCVNGGKPTGGRRHRIEHSPPAAHQYAVRSDPRWDAAYDAPSQNARYPNNNHQPQNPIGGPGDADQMIQLLGGCHSFERGGAKYVMRGIAHG